jgi:hypothetical protein
MFVNYLNLSARVEPNSWASLPAIRHYPQGNCKQGRKQDISHKAGLLFVDLAGVLS